jgi:predicted amidohydrolase
MPFWFWNDELTDDQIVRQMADFRDHGVYGFVIHARMGLPKTIPYMGERWIHFVRTAVAEAARTDMRICLYDEGMYPSGSAHGEVVKSNPVFAARGLAMDVRDVTGPASVPLQIPSGAEHVGTVVARRASGTDAIDGSSLRAIDVEAGRIPIPAGNWRVMTFTCVPSEGRIRGVHEDEEDSQPTAPAAADLLNPQAVQAFLHFAYEPYYAALGTHFGTRVIGVFTDEPSMLGRRPRRGLKPWTTGFAAYFQEKRGYSPVPLLPGLFMDIGEKTQRIRHDMQLTLAERLDESYYSQLSRWCDQHGIALTGHPAGATEIQPLRFFQIPGQDIVWRGVLPQDNKPLQGANSAIAKCSSSVARHDGRLRNSNEVFGAFGWQLTMEEMKWLSDWLMVRGVNLLQPHAFYYSIREQRGNERPPDVGPHNAWWPHYKVFADYTARVCGLLAGSRQVCEVAILGGNDDLPWRAAEFLFRNQVDFNYLEDWRLVQQAKFEGGRLVVGPMDYSLLIVDQDAPPTGRVAEALVRLESAGARIHYCRGRPDAALIEGLARDVQAAPAAPDLRYTHVVRDGVDFYFLVNEGESRIATQLTVHRTGRAEWFDPWQGTFTSADATICNTSSLSVWLTLERRASVVLCIDPAQPVPAATPHQHDYSPGTRTALASPWSVWSRDGRQVGDTLGDWLTSEATAKVVGTLTYRTSFDIAKSADTEYAIDLGAIGDFAALTLNGHALPVRFWAPYRWSVTEWLHDGRNELAVDVTNSLVNQYAPGSRRPSGLLGPVEIVSMPVRKSQPSSATRPSTSAPSAPHLRVAAIQMLPAAGDVQSNTRHADELVRQAVARHGAQVIVLPECTVQGYLNPADGRLTLAHTRELAEPVPGPSTERFGRLAGALGVYIVLGLHERRGDNYLNSAALLSPEGHLVGTYSKVHINKYEGQMGWAHGDRFEVWPCRIGEMTFNIGIMICYDREVPEAARCLAMLGADLILVPQATSCTARFPIHRDELRVRAFENEVYVAMANWAGPSFLGHSMIVDPRGEVMKLGGTDEEILVADVDLEALARLRAGGIYGRHHRQPASYGPLVAPSSCPDMYHAQPKTH